MRTHSGIEDRFVFIHLGALGGLYLSEDIADFLAVARARDPRVFGMFLTQSDPNIIVSLLKDRGFAESDFFVGKVAASEVENYLYASDVGLSFVKASYSTASRSPTKIPEYLACGLPVVANAGVGDVDRLIVEEQVGILLDGFSETDFAGAAEAVMDLVADPGTLQRCRTSAAARFDLATVGAERYRRIFRRLDRG